MVPIMQAMTKGKVSIRISSRGQILEVTLPQEMLDAAGRPRHSKAITFEDPRAVASGVEWLCDPLHFA
jgi:hypothetical protein